MGAYIVNGVDLETATGFIAGSDRSTSNSIETPNNPKPVFSHDWQDENGVEYDLTSPLAYEPRLFRIDGHIVADSESDYIAKKSSFISLLSSGLLTIQSLELGETVEARLRQFSSWERLTKIKGESRIVTRVSVELDEVFTDANYSRGDMEYTLESYAAMLAIIPFEKSGRLYKYSIKHDEVNSGGMPAEYRRCDGDFIRLVPQNASA